MLVSRKRELENQCCYFYLTIFLFNNNLIVLSFKRFCFTMSAYAQFELYFYKAFLNQHTTHSVENWLHHSYITLVHFSRQAAQPVVISLNYISTGAPTPTPLQSCGVSFNSLSRLLQTSFVLSQAKLVWF